MDSPSSPAQRALDSLGALAAAPWQEIAQRAGWDQVVVRLPIASPRLRQIPICPDLASEQESELVDLREVVPVGLRHRLCPLITLQPGYGPGYPESSIVRRGVFVHLVAMLDILPKNIGIAYFEGLRPLSVQKAYFDKKFREEALTGCSPIEAYWKAAQSVSPYIDNIPVHSTGAAIDIHLFRLDDRAEGGELLDLGMFDTIFGPNTSQETFSPETTTTQRQNRLRLLEASSQVGLVNYGYEWWHYSYGDRVWAFATGMPHALFGAVVMNEDVDLPSTLDGFFAQMGV